MRNASSLFAVVASVAAGLSLVAVSAPAAAGATANDCVSFSTATVSSGIAFDVKNTCDKRLACALTWTLSCENASGKVTSKSKHDARFVVGADEAHQMTGSSATCKDGWSIDDIAWDCAPSATK